MKKDFLIIPLICAFCACICLPGCKDEPSQPQVFQSGTGDYIVVYSESFNDLSIGVNYRLAEGYVCQERVGVKPITPYQSYLFQVMVKPK